MTTIRLASTAALLMAALVSGCGKKTEGQFIDEYADAYCSFVSACSLSTFQSAYVNGQVDCIATFKRGLTSQQLDAAVTCSTDQQSQCLSDISTLTCGASLLQSPVPTSCSCP